MSRQFVDGITILRWVNAPDHLKVFILKEFGGAAHMEEKQIDRLIVGMEVCHQFFLEAHKIAKVRKHYSARTIVEVLRHNSALADGDKSYKINDHIIPLLSRISMEIFPALNALFETREKQFKLENQSIN